MQNNTNIPAGHRQDAHGRLVPESLIKPIDKLRDELVHELVEQARQANAVLAGFKERAFADIAAFVEMSAEQYRVRLGGKKGNVTLLSFNGRYKVQRAVAEHIAFDERLQAAKALIDECLVDWTDGARSELRLLVQDAFRAGKSGEISTARVLALRRHDIADERWQRAMRAIGEAVQAVGSKSYVRIYERDDAGRYQPIALDMAGA